MAEESVEYHFCQSTIDLSLICQKTEVNDHQGNIGAIFKHHDHVGFLKLSVTIKIPCDDVKATIPYNVLKFRCYKDVF